MSAFDLTTIPLAPNDGDAALALVPSVAGVGQILAADERNLVIGRPSNLRRWAAGHLGRSRPVKVAPGKLPPRPPTDLTPIAVAIAFVKTTSAFGQRLAFERLMARYVPLAKRRDLKRPAYLRLDAAEPLPKLLVQPLPDGADVFGPFKDSRAATRARDALLKHFRLRPCDFDFKPAHDLPEGLAADLARALDGAGGVPEVPDWVRRAGGRSIIVEPMKDGLELYPVVGGGVVEEAAVAATPEALEQSIDALAWTCVVPPRHDTPWLNAWRYGKRTGREIPIAPGESASAVAARVRQALGEDASAVGGMVG